MKRKHNHSKTKGVKTIPLAVAVATLSAGLTLGTGGTAAAASSDGWIADNANRQEILIDVGDGKYIAYKADGDADYQKKLKAALEEAYKKNYSILVETTNGTYQEISKNITATTQKDDGQNYLVLAEAPEAEKVIEVY
jgi:hypothetical protein